MSCYVDELEGQRRELEARRTMLEERFKLRLATAQVFAIENVACKYLYTHHRLLQIDLELRPKGYAI